jgi:flagellin
MGGMAINHNTSALNTHRNLLVVNKDLKTTLEHLSGGLRVVRAADGPATLMISEQMRAQIGSVVQAIRNSETSVSMVQTTEAALDEMNRMLVSIRQLAIHAANEGANDKNMLDADQFEVKNALESIDRISKQAQFGTKKILDGSNGVSGLAAGPGLAFLKASTVTRNSPDAGYEVKVTQAATRARFVGTVPLTRELIDSGVRLALEESGRVAEYTTRKGEDLSAAVRNLTNAAEMAGLRLTLDTTPDGLLAISHLDHGADAKFTVVSSVPGVLSQEDKVPLRVQNGTDVAGTINNQLTYGRGRILTAGPGTEADGLQVIYEGEMPENPEQPVGRVSVTQRSLTFQIGPNAGQRVRIALNALSTRTLGTNIPNESGYRNISELDVHTVQGSNDAMALIEKAIDDVNVVRGTLGAIQKNSLESNIRSLHVSREELISAESVMRDADMAEEMAEFTRNQILVQSGIAMLGHANQVPQHILSLLKQ